MDPARIKQLFVADHTCVRVVTHEETEVVEAGLETARLLGLEPWCWSATVGVRRMALEDETPIPETTNPARAMIWLARSLAAPSLVITLDLGEQLADSLNLRAFRDLLETLREGRMGAGVHAPTGRILHSGVLMIDCTDHVPAVIGAASARHEIRMPDDEEIRDLVRGTLRGVRRRENTKIDVNLAMGETEFFRAMVHNLRGLTRRQIRQLVTQTVAVDRALTDDDLAAVQMGKRVLLQDSGVLEFVDAPTSMDQIGGLGALKRWLREREGSFDDRARDFGLSPPRGVLLLGVQGAGKSLASKAIATAWKRPLMRLDPGSLFDKYIGETERKLREALRQGEAMAPVVLWIDEIEKGFTSSASASTDGGVSRRMFGTLLTWMQEHRAPVFLVATANDIEALPPELLRKGRFDEIFFVDLPTGAARGAIFAIHLKKRKQNPARFDLTRLADATEGYSGAEIEQAVLSALHRAYSDAGAVTTETLIEAARGSPPLSVTMREKVDWLRAWAKGRCVPAD